MWHVGCVRHAEGVRYVRQTLLTLVVLRGDDEHKTIKTIKFAVELQRTTCDPEGLPIPQHESLLLGSEEECENAIVCAKGPQKDRPP